MKGKLAEVTVDATDIAPYPDQADQTLSHSGQTVLPLAGRFVGSDCLTGATRSPGFVALVDLEYARTRVLRIARFLLS